MSKFSFAFSLLVFVVVSCVPDPGRIRLRYPNDFEFVSGYFDRQQSAGYWEVEKVELANQIVILASRDIRGGNIIINILDVKDPKLPREIATYETTLTKVDDMHVVDNYVFLAGRREGIEVIDIAQPAHPAHVGQYEHTNELATSLVIVNHYLYYYVPEGDYSAPVPRWHILNISNPEEVSLTGEIFSLYEPMTVSESYILATERVDNVTTTLFQIIDVTSSTTPIVLSETKLENLWVYGIEVKDDDLAYISVGSGLRIMDISDPLAPTMIRGDLFNIGSFVNMDMADNIIVGDFIFALEVEVPGQSVNVNPLARLNLEKFMKTFCEANLSLPHYSGETKAVLCSVPSASFDQAPNDLVITNGFVYIASKRAGLLIFQVPFDNNE